MYNFFTSSKGAQIIGKGWKKAGISGLLDGTTIIPSADPFSRIYSETLEVYYFLFICFTGQNNDTEADHTNVNTSNCHEGLVALS